MVSSFETGYRNPNRKAQMEGRLELAPLSQQSVVNSALHYLQKASGSSAMAFVQPTENSPLMPVSLEQPEVLQHTDPCPEETVTVQ